jgi:FkbH-like protein
MRIDWLQQARYFGDEAGLSTLPREPRDDDAPRLTLRIARNHPVELTARLVARFGAYLGARLTVQVGDYDDSFTFAMPGAPPDALLLWPDWRRISSSSLPRVIEGMQSQAVGVPSTRVIPPQPGELLDNELDRITGLLRDAGLMLYPPFFDGPLLDRDNRLQDVSGSDISFPAQFALARDIAIGWLGSLIAAPLKVLVVDLDNTLYSGVLGEDGAERLIFAADHLVLLDSLSRLNAQGVLICVATRNNPRDLDALAAAWPDAGFSLAEAALIRASWDEKSAVIAQMAAQLGATPASVVLVDDNPGELATAAQANPGLWPVLADHASQAVRVLQTQRHRASSRIDTTGGARTADARLHSQRADILESSHSLPQLHEQLGTRIRTWRADESDLERVVDLLKRTNQFNLTLARMDAARIREAWTADDQDILLASVADDLSDSGTTAVMVVRRTPKAVRIEELAVSCRVLGRGLETALVLGMLRAMDGWDADTFVEFLVVHGARNEPAQRWVAAASGQSVAPEGVVTIVGDELERQAADILLVVRLEQKRSRGGP